MLILLLSEINIEAFGNPGETGRKERLSVLLFDRFRWRIKTRRGARRERTRHPGERCSSTHTKEEEEEEYESATILPLPLPPPCHAMPCHASAVLPDHFDLLSSTGPVHLGSWMWREQVRLKEKDSKRIENVSMSQNACFGGERRNENKRAM